MAKKNLNVKNPVLKLIMNLMNLKNLKQLAEATNIPHTSIMNWERTLVISDVKRLREALPNDIASEVFDKSFKGGSIIIKQTEENDFDNLHLRRKQCQNPVIRRIIQHYDFDTLKELSDHTKIPYSTLFKWDMLGIADTNRLIAVLPEINPEFIRTGDGDVTRQSVMNIERIVELEKKIQKLENDLALQISKEKQMESLIADYKSIIENQKDFISSIKTDKNTPH